MSVGYYPNRSGEILAAGISQAGGSIAEAITRVKAENKKLTALRGAATDIFGMEPDQVDKMSAEDIEAHMSGMVLKNTLEKAKAEQRAVADAEQQRTAATQFTKFLDPTSGGQQGPPAPLTPERFLNAANQSGVRLEPREILALMRQNEGTDWANVMPREFEIGGMKGAVGKGGQFQFLPQTTPESLTAIPVYDDTGNVVGQRVPTTRGGTAALPAAKGPKELPASFFAPYHEALQEISAAQQAAARSDDELKAIKTPGTPAEKRQRYEQNAKAAQERLRKHLELYKSQGYGQPEVWEQLFQGNNLTAPAAQGKPAALSGAGSGAAGRLPTATNPKTGEKMVYENGAWKPLN
jgi:hypothetical protein